MVSKTKKSKRSTARKKAVKKTTMTKRSKVKRKPIRTKASSKTKTNKMPMPDTDNNLIIGLLITVISLAILVYSSQSGLNVNSPVTILSGVAICLGFIISVNSIKE